jgi:shikimate dehydrogenase
MELPLQLGIIGYPLGHSLSPLLHAELLKATGLSGEYRAYELKPEDLASGLESLQEAGICGLNVTIPHKVAVMPFLDWIHPEAQLVGAVNTLVLKGNGERLGYNTDLAGFMRSLPEAITKRLPESSVLILGAGGSARAVLSALIQLQTAEVTFAVRNPESAMPILNLAGEVREFHQSATDIHLLSLQELPALGSFQGIVNTTPVGMWPAVQESPLSAIQMEALPEGAFVYDLIYRPLETRLLSEAKALGCSVFNGLDMLIHQGIAAFELWTGRAVPVHFLPILRGTLAQAVLHPVK